MLNLPALQTQFRDLSGIKLPWISLSISKNFLLPWTKGMSTLMTSKTLEWVLLWSKRSNPTRSAQSETNPNGFRYLALGARLWGTFILTGFKNLRSFWRLSLMYSEPPRGNLIEPYSLTWKSVIATLGDHSGWMIEVNSTFRSWLNSFRPLILVRPCEGRNGLIMLLLHLLQNVQTLLAANGALALVRRILVQTSGSMVSASFVGNLIEPKTIQPVLHPSIEIDHRPHHNFNSHPQSSEPRSISLKRKDNNEYPDIPRFRRRFMWPTLDDPDVLSPAARLTEKSPPLASPPEHLIHDPQIQQTLNVLKDAIEVKTPFDADKLEMILTDHPNPTFVIGNYATEELDLDVIRAFRDNEISAERWSQPLRFSNLLPGMKISPMFVVWQEKPRVVTDHSASGLNDGIPRSEAKVQYDDMHPFGRTLRDVKAKHVTQRIILFKSDISSAFLNLRAHPIWQIRQTVVVDKFMYIVRRLVFGNRASPRCWCAVSGLLCWIATQKLDIRGLHVYMDDFFGWDFADNLIQYRGTQRP